MKAITSKTITSLIVSATLFASVACKGQNYNQYGQTNSGAQCSQVGASNSSQAVMKTISNPQTGQIIAQMPLPSSWTINVNQAPQDPTATGPGGIEIRSFAGESYTYSTDPYTNQIYQQSGQQVRQPAGIETIIKRDLMQETQQHGLQFEKMYALPKLAQADKAYSDQLYAYGEQQKSFQVAGAEYIGKEGKKELLIVHYFETFGMGMYFWGYTIQNLSAPQQVFESAKNTYLYALENIQYNPAAIAAYNAQESAKHSANDAAFQNRMRNNQANFEATQRAHVNSSNAVNEAQMGIYRSQSESFNRSNQQISNGILEENTIYNSTNGESYQAEGHSNAYWMNANGEYIPTDNSLYNPNLDQHTNSTEWVEGEPR
jgi:hypothetical protein